MAISVQMPALGESVTEGTVTRWLKQEGDTVEQDEPLLEVSTDKVDTEIPSPAAGVLKKIVAQEDDTVEVGGELAVIGDASESDGEAPAAQAPAAEEAPAEKEKPAEEPAAQPEPAAEEQGARTRTGQAGRAVLRRRPSDLREDARARRVGDRGHRDAVAEEGRRLRRGRRTAGRGFHRQGRHRDPVAGGGHAGVHHRRGGRHRRRRRRARQDR